MNDLKKSRLEFWDSRSAMGMAAGSNDVNLKKLEMDQLIFRLKDAKNMLDAGCGNGATAIRILQRYPNARLNAFDYSDKMVEATKSLAREEGVLDRLTVQTGDLLSPPYEGQLFDAIYTERALINLDSFDAQMSALSKLSERLSPNGVMLLCESFLDGVDEINAFRESIGLELITPPWHNNYFRMDELKERLPSHLEIREIDNFSSTYYFISRVVNAWLAKQNGAQPDYDDPINKISFSLPSIGMCAQTKIVIVCRKQDMLR